MVHSFRVRNEGSPAKPESVGLITTYFELLLMSSEVRTMKSFCMGCRESGCVTKMSVIVKFEIRRYCRMFFRHYSCIQISRDSRNLEMPRFRQWDMKIILWKHCSNT
jgi:hypothetical protein